MSIADTIEFSKEYHMVFPNVKPDKNRGWSRDTLYVVRKDTNNPYATVYGTGIDGPYQGVHVNRIIVDDPTDQQDVRSEVTMQQQRDRVHGVLLDRLNPIGSITVILTRWGEADLVQDFVGMGFTVIENPVEGHYPWGHLLCPQLFSDNRIQEIQEAKGSAFFALTYMCSPDSATGSKVKREWWQYYDTLPAMERIIHSWDLSTGRKGGDYSAYGCWGVGEDGYYLMDAGHWSLTMDELIKKMSTLHAMSRPSRILVEDAGTSIPVIDYLRNHTRLPIEAIKPGARDKESRLDGVVHLIEAKRVWLPAQATWASDFVSECAMFPGGIHDDQVDQMTQALTYLEHHGGLKRRGSVNRHYAIGMRAF